MDSHADKARRPLDSTPVSPSMFAHFVLRTSDRGPLRDWYLKVLNARQVFENEYISFITYDDEHHRVAFVQIPGLKKAPDDDLTAIAAAVAASADALEDATKWVAQSAGADLVNALAGSVPFLRLAGTALGGWLLGKSALVAQGKLATRDGDPAFLEAKVITARFFAEVILPPALAQLGPLKAAGRTVFALKEEQF